MAFKEGLLAIVTTIASFVTWLPLDAAGNLQSGLRLQLPLSPAEPASTSGVHSDAGPIFQPPGTLQDSSFVCDYSNMIGWEACSTEEDRSCWLKRTSDGKKYDIFTDYENDAPIGIERYYELDLADETLNADGIEDVFAKVFNGSYPGPWIEACWGDTLVVLVKNNLVNEGTSIHWHGVRQNQSMQMDGVNGVTQCPIAPNQSFLYNFTVTQYGSTWYHSHYSVQYADGAAGPMTFHGPNSAGYTDAISPPLVISDWGHNAAFNELETGNLDNFDILVNGVGDIKRFNNTAVYNATGGAPPIYNMVFAPAVVDQPIKRYLIRVINTSFASTFIFSIDNHLLQVVSADFVPIHPYTTTSILVGIGQRYDLIVEAWPTADPKNPGIEPPSDGNFWIRTNLSSCLGKASPPAGDDDYDQTAILRYDSTSKSDPTSVQWVGIPTDCQDESVNDLHPIVPWQIGRPSNSGVEMYASVTGSPSKGNSNFTIAFWSLGGTNDNALQVDYQNITFTNLDRQGDWPAKWRVLEEEFSDNLQEGTPAWVYLVIENGNIPASHPMHLHGHDFAILEQAGNKVFNPNNVSLNLDNPPRRDVVLLPKTGYVIIAFKADNPGTWLVHCHIAFHVAEGLGMQILENQQAANDLWPQGSSAINDADKLCQAWSDHCGKNPSTPLCEPLDSGV